VQLSASDEVRGRVLGIWSMMVSLGLPLGCVLSGWVADLRMEAVALTEQGLVCTALAVLLFGCWFWFGRGRSETRSLP
jgi:hypothetical protein